MDKKLEKEKELYRKERKERIAKNAKSNEKGSAKGKDKTAVVSRVLTWIVSVALVLAIVIGTLFEFGVPGKVFKAIKIDGKSYSAAEYGFYYKSVYNMFYQYAKNYGSTYADGFDANISPADQSHKDSDGNTQTFDEYFAHLAADNMAEVKRYYAKALENNVELTDEDNKTIEESLTQIDDTIKSSKNPNLSRSSYLQQVFGKGITEKLFKKILTEQQYVTRFKEIENDKISDGISDDEVNAEYTANKKDYDVVDFRWYTITIDADAADADKAKSDAEAQADKFIAAVKSEGNTEDAFKEQAIVFLDKDDADYESNKENYSKNAATVLHKTDYATISSSVSKDAADWVYSVDDNGNYNKKAGEMARYTTDKYVYILYTLGTPYQDDVKPVSVRHILAKFPDTEKGVELTDAQKQETKAKAEKVLAEYQSKLKESGKDYDEDAFVELVSANSDDTGTSSKGGLIEGMINNDQYVEQFEDWAFAEGDYKGEERKAGDVDIIETEYGYHVMYFVGQDDEPSWYQTIKESLVSDKSTKYWDDFNSQFSEDNIVTTEWVEKKVIKKQLSLAGY